MLVHMKEMVSVVQEKEEDRGRVISAPQVRIHVCMRGSGRCRAREGEEISLSHERRDDMEERRWCGREVCLFVMPLLSLLQRKLREREVTKEIERFGREI